MTHIAILWHMHQPFYEDLATGEHIMPWVRLHALKDYYGMVALLREFPSVKVTFNLVPSLLVQLEKFAADRARERYLDLSLKPAADLDDSDIDFIVASFFDAQRQHLIDPNPRYAELLALRGGAAGSETDRRSALGRFSRDDLRDLQVWHKLAWVDPLYWDRDPRVRQLVAKGRGYTEEDKHLLREVELEILNRVIPEYREAADRGQIEISASPFYHPILPLLCDSQVYLRTHPDSRPPRFMHAEDAAEQLDRAVRCHERLFGRRPSGLWPSEGSVSDAMVPLATKAGFQWMATDELILARTLNISFSRDGRNQIDQPERLYVPYTLRIGDRTVQCAFRDHALSDLIGFTYSGWAAEAAADDFVSRLVEAGRRFRARNGDGGEAFIPIILDGENAWEYFEGGGRPFLRALYSRLSNHSELRTVTMTEGCARSGPTLPGIFPGSWIDANFYIWIGHADDQKAWSQLADARRALEQTSGIAAEARATAEEEVYIAEGSDWFWWYGDDHSSAHDLEFDDLFRRHLRNLYRLLQKDVPEELFVSNISTGGSAPVQTTPTALLSPTIDGEETSYFEWLRAGSFETRERAGAMHQADRQPDVLTLIRFGFDREQLFVRVDAVEPIADLLQSGREISLKFLVPEGLRYSVRVEQRGNQGTDGGRTVGEVSKWQEAERRWLNSGPLGFRVAAGTVLEVALPLADLGVKAGGAIELFVALSEGGDHEIERHPAHRPIELTVPDELFEARQWQA